MVRIHLDREGAQNGLLGLLAHRQAGRAVAAMLDDPARCWTLDELAARANASRASRLALIYDSIVKQREDVRPRSRGAISPELCVVVPPFKTRGRREDRVRAAPAVPCALVVGKKCTRAYRFSGGNPAFPARWLYDLSRALPGVRAF